MPPLSQIDPCESALITPAGAINRSMLMRIALQRARRELAAYAAIGRRRRQNIENHQEPRMPPPFNLLTRPLEPSGGRSKARSREKPIADVERTAATLHELMRALESRLSSLGSCVDELDAALAIG